MICPNCNKNVEDGLNSCPYCGFEFIHEEEKGFFKKKLFFGMDDDYFDDYELDEEFKNKNIRVIDEDENITEYKTTKEENKKSLINFDNFKKKELPKEEDGEENKLHKNIPMIAGIAVVVIILLILVLPRFLMGSKLNFNGFYVKSNNIYGIDENDKKEIDSNVDSDLENIVYDSLNNKYYYATSDAIKYFKNNKTTTIDTGKNIEIHGIFDSKLYYTKASETKGKILMYYDNKNVHLVVDNVKNFCIDLLNKKTYFEDTNNVLSYIDSKFNNIAIEQNAEILGVVNNLGVVFRKVNVGTFYFDGKETKKITNQQLNAKIVQKTNSTHLYLDNRKPAEMKATDYIYDDLTNVSGDPMTATDYNIAKALREKTFDHSLFDIYFVSSKTVTQIATDIYDYFVNNEFCTFEKLLPFGNKKEKLSYIVNKYENDENILDKYLNDFFRTRTRFIYVFKGTEGARLNLKSSNVAIYDVVTNNKQELFLLFDNKELHKYIYEGSKILDYNMISNSVYCSNVKNKLVSHSEKIFYIKNHDSKNLAGTLVVYDNGDEKDLTDNVYDYYVVDDNEVFAIKNYSEEGNSGELYCINADSKQRVDGGVQKFLRFMTNEVYSNVFPNVISRVGKDFSEDQFLEKTEVPDVNVGFVEKDNEKYYVKPDGDIALDEDVFIDNEWFHFDEDGVLVKSSWVYDSYFGDDGKLVRGMWVGDYYLGLNGKVVRNDVIDGKEVGADGKIVKNSTKTSSDNSKMTTTNIKNNSSSSSSNETESSKSNNVNVNDLYNNGANVIIQPADNANNVPKEIKVFYIKSYNDFQEFNYKVVDGYTSVVRIKTPILGGENENEVATANEYLKKDVVKKILEKAEQKIVGKSEPLKSFTINTAEVVLINKSVVRVNMLGKQVDAKDETTDIRFRYTYDRIKKRFTVDSLSTKAKK